MTTKRFSGDTVYYEGEAQVAHHHLISEWAWYNYFVSQCMHIASGQ